MEAAAIAALVGGIVSFVVERIPAVKKWLGAIPLWADYLIFAGLFFAIPLGLAGLACYGYVLPIAPATCPADKPAVLELVKNCAVAFMSSQVWHAYVNDKLKTGNEGVG